MRKLVSFILLVILVLMLSACTGELPVTSSGESIQSTTTPASFFSPSSPITINLSISKLPVLNEVADLTCNVMSRFDAPNSAVNISLSKGIRLVSGNLQWQGELKSNIIMSFSIQLAFEETGHQTIEATAVYIVDNANSWGDLDAIFFDIGSETSTFGWPVNPIRITRVPDKWSVITTDLQISHAPKLNEPAKLFITILSPVDFPDINAEIIFYEGVEFLEGETRQQIELKANVPFHLSSIVVFTETGIHTVTADVAELVDGIWYSSPQDTITFDIGVEQSTYQHGLPQPTETPDQQTTTPPTTHT